jgi:glycerophosphoryl diester phosphodiesterase
MDIRKSWIVTRPVAHRGFHNAEAPENSLAAFERAVQNGFAIELDVRLIDDGTVIVFHDDLLTRMTKADGYAGNLKYEALAGLRLADTDQTIPTFEQVLELVNGRTPILIETKNIGGVGALESKVAKQLAKYNGEVALQSFNPYSMEYFKLNAPQYPRGQLAMIYKKGQLTWIKRYVLSRLKMNHVSKPDFVSYCAGHLPNPFVKRTKLPVLAWTVRSGAEAEKVSPYCDNIIFEGFTPRIAKNDE